jgi:hypothetical protein
MGRRCLSDILDARGSEVQLNAVRAGIFIRFALALAEADLVSKSSSSSPKIASS